MMAQNFSPDGPIPQFGKGRSPLLSKNHKPIIDHCNSWKKVVIKRAASAKDADRVVQSASGVTIWLKKEGGDSSTPTNVSVKLAEITDVHGDYLEANQWNEAGNIFDEAMPVNIAKPHYLRASVGDGSEYDIAFTYDNYDSPGNQREATYDDAGGLTATVVQRVYPPYKVGDIVAFAETTEKVGVSTYTRIDLNLAARQWRTETEGCDEDGDPVYAFVARSPWRTDAVGEKFA